MKKMMMVLMIAFTMVTGLFAEERKWNIEYHIRTVTTGEFYTSIRLNPYWQEYDRWIDADDDTLVDYMDPYWDNDVVKTAMQRISQEEESVKEEHKYDEKYAYVEISYGDSFGDQLNTRRLFILDLKTYEMWEFCFSEAVLSFQKRHSVKGSEKE